MPVNDKNQDEFDKIFGKSNSGPSTSQPGEFTRNFFGAGTSSEKLVPAETKSPALDNQSTGVPGILPPAPAPAPLSSPAPGDFTQIFGSVSPSGHMKLASAQERPEPQVQDMGRNFQPAPPTKLFGAGDSIQEQPPATSLQPGGFTRLFAVPSGSKPVSAEESPFAPGADRYYAQHLQPPAMSREPHPPEASRDSLAPGWAMATPPAVPSAPATAQSFATDLGSQEMPSEKTPMPGGYTRLFNKLPPPVQMQQREAASGEFFSKSFDNALPGPPMGSNVNEDPSRVSYRAPDPPANAPRGVQEATGVFSLQNRGTDNLNLQNGPSAYTRIVNASAMRSQQNVEQPSRVPSDPAPAFPGGTVLTPPNSSWPMGAVSAPSYVPVTYPQTPAVPVHMNVPSVSPGSWSAPSPLGMVQATPPSVQFAPPPTPQPASTSKLVTYLPLIIALNVLFFLAVLLILVFALRGR